MEKFIFGENIICCDYDSHIERFLPDGNTTHYVEGYSCEVFDSSDEALDDPTDFFCLGVGHEISNLSIEELKKGITRHMGLAGLLSDALSAPAEREFRAFDNQLFKDLFADIKANLKPVGEKYGVDLTLTSDCEYTEKPFALERLTMEITAEFDHPNPDTADAEKFWNHVYH